MRWVFAVSVVLERLCNGIGRVAAWALIPLMLVIVIDVVGRRYFAIGSVRLQELEWHLHAVIFMFCIGYAYLKNAHVRIELIRERLPCTAQIVIEILGILALLLPLCWILVDYSSDLVARSYAANERSPHPSGLPNRWLIKLVMPVGFALLMISALSVLLRAVTLIFGSPELRERARTPIFADPPSGDVRSKTGS